MRVAWGWGLGDLCVVWPDTHNYISSPCFLWRLLYLRLICFRRKTLFRFFLLLPYALYARWHLRHQVRQYQQHWQQRQRQDDLSYKNLNL